MSILCCLRCESELIQRLLRGQGNVCLRSGASSGGMIGDNKSCKCLRAQNVFAHKREFVAFQETLRANTWFQQNCTFCFLAVTPGMNSVALASILVLLLSNLLAKLYCEHSTRLFKGTKYWCYNACLWVPYVPCHQCVGFYNC